MSTTTAPSDRPDGDGPSSQNGPHHQDGRSGQDDRGHPRDGADPAAQPPQRWDELGIVRRRGVRGWFRRHPRWMNAVVVGVYLLTALWWFPVTLLDMGADGFWMLPAYGIAGLLLCFRNRVPWTVLILMSLVEAVMLGFYPWHSVQMLGLALAAYCVGREKGLVRALIGGVAACIPGYLTFIWADRWTAVYGESAWTSEIFAEIYGPGSGPSSAELMLMLAFAGVASVAVTAAIGAAVGRGRRHEREIFEWARRSQEFAQVSERNRIAREMHDVVAHSLSVMISLADGAKVVMPRDPQRAADVLGELSLTGRSALADMRRVIGVLKKGDDVVEARRPVRETLGELYEGFRQAGLPLKVTTSGPPLPEDPAFGLTVHRIIQESLTNVLRYGRQVSEVDVRVENSPGVSQEEADQMEADGLSEQDQAALGMQQASQVIITVTDDGVPPAGGAGESVGSGQGIRGMGERAAFYNGSVYAGPGRRRGWMVRAVLEPPSEAGAVR